MSKSSFREWISSNTSFTFKGVNGGGLKAFTEEIREALVMKSCVFPSSSCDRDSHFTPPQKLLKVTRSVSRVRETVGESNSLNPSESVILCHYLVTPCYVM